MKESKGLIIIPAYNEEKNIGALIHEIRINAANLDILVINDHSTDSTSSIVKSLDAQVVDLPCNLGYGGAVQTGFKYAIKNHYDFCIQIDGDGQHDPRGIHAIIHELQENGVDVVLGSRFLGNVLYKVPLPRRIGMNIFGKIVKLLTGIKVTDPTSGYQGLSSRAIRFLANDNYPIDYPDADTLIVINYAGFKIKEVPVTMRQRMYGESMHSNLKALNYVLKMFLTVFIIVLRGRKYYLKENYT